MYHWHFGHLYSTSVACILVCIVLFLFFFLFFLFEKNPHIFSFKSLHLICACIELHSTSLQTIAAGWIAELLLISHLFGFYLENEREREHVITGKRKPFNGILHGNPEFLFFVCAFDCKLIIGNGGGKQNYEWNCKSVGVFVCFVHKQKRLHQSEMLVWESKSVCVCAFNHWLWNDTIHSYFINRVVVVVVVVAYFILWARMFAVFFAALRVRITYTVIWNGLFSLHVVCVFVSHTQIYITIRKWQVGELSYCFFFTFFFFLETHKNVFIFITLRYQFGRQFERMNDNTLLCVCKWVCVCVCVCECVDIDNAASYTTHHVHSIPKSRPFSHRIVLFLLFYFFFFFFRFFLFDDKREQHKLHI